MSYIARNLTLSCSRKSITIVHQKLRSTTPTLLLNCNNNNTILSNINIICHAPILLSSKRHLNVFAEFVKSVKRQVAENKEFQQNVKQLSDETTRLADSDAVQRAKKVGSASTSTMVKGIKTAAETVGTVVDKTMETPVVKKTVETVSKVAEKTAETVEKVAEPILDTKAAKTIASGVKTIKKELVDTSSTARYSEYKPKEIREKERAERDLDQLASNPFDSKRLGPISANPEAGAEVVMHQSSQWTEKWKSFKENNTVFKGFLRARRSVEESDNPVVERVRDWFSGWGEETEQAQVVRLFKMADPSFTIEKFMKDVTEYYLPEIMEAYLQGDMTTLQVWCSEQLCAQFGAGIQAQRTQGLISSSRLLDLRKVELVQTKILDNDIPILLIDFNTQEILLFKNKKGEVVLGSEDDIQHVRYRAVFTKDQSIDPTIPLNPKTIGWRCQECVRLDHWSSI